MSTTNNKDYDIGEEIRAWGVCIPAQAADEVVKALADAVTGRFKDLSHRYYKLKSKWFNMDKLNWWDRNAPLPNKPNQKWSWSEAREIVLTSFNELSPEIAKIASKFFNITKVNLLKHIMISRIESLGRKFIP